MGCMGRYGVLVWLGAAASGWDAAQSFQSSWLRGLSFGGGEHSGEAYGTAACQRSLANLASTGATHVRLEVTWFQANASATAIEPLTTPGSPLRSVHDAALAATVAAALALNLNVSLAPLVDLDWDAPSVNVPDGAGAITDAGLNQWVPSPYAQSRANIGRALDQTEMTEAQWAAWFVSYTTFLMHYAAFAEQHEIKLLDLATDLQTALVHPANAPRWVALVKAVRAVYTGKVMLTSGCLEPAHAVPQALLSVVDVIGVDMANSSLSAAPYTHLMPGQSQYTWTVADERLNLTTSAVAAAWRTGPGSTALSSLRSLHAANPAKPVVLIVGYQSRPNCVVRPSGQPRLDCSEDCSCWTMCVDMDCQAAAYDGLLQVVAGEAWFSGVFFRGWSADPTAGGTSDPHYTPWAKPSEAVLRRWYKGGGGGASAGAAPSDADGVSVPAGPVRSSTAELARELRDTNSARIAALTSAAPPPLGVLMNNTRVAVNDVPSLPAFPCPSADACLKHCEANSSCGFIVFREQWEPSVGDGSCVGAVHNESCCYPGPMQHSYPLAHNGAAATAGFVAAIVRYAPPPPPPPLRAPTLNGYVYGGGEWSYPGFALDSDESKLSIDAAAATGANSLEFTPMWYFDAQNSTSMYPIGWHGDGRETDVMRTATDEELHGAISYAQSLGLTVILSPMLDPDYHRFKPMWTRDCAPNPWRGTIGSKFGSDCTAGSAWREWFGNYKRFLLHYAALAHTWNVTQFVVTHELYMVNDGWDIHHTGDGPCNDILEDIVASVRLACPRCVLSTVITRRNSAPYGPKWYSKLDMLATDFYPSQPVPHPDLVWQSDVDLPAKFAASIAAAMDQYNRTSNYFNGMKVLITEYGFQSHPWVYSSKGGGAITGSNPGLQDVASCAITDQCVSMEAQALGYDLSMAAIFAQPWFAGIQVWLWRADPTHGGSESDTYTPHGKQAAAVVNKWFTSMPPTPPPPPAGPLAGEIDSR